MCPKISTLTTIYYMAGRAYHERVLAAAQGIIRPRVPLVIDATDMEYDIYFFDATLATEFPDEFYQQPRRRVWSGFVMAALFKATKSLMSPWPTHVVTTTRGYPMQLGAHPKATVLLAKIKGLLTLDAPRLSIPAMVGGSGPDPGGFDDDGAGAEDDEDEGSDGVGRAQAGGGGLQAKDGNGLESGRAHGSFADGWLVHKGLPAGDRASNAAPTSSISRGIAATGHTSTVALLDCIDKLTSMAFSGPELMATRDGRAHGVVVQFPESRTAQAGTLWLKSEEGQSFVDDSLSRLSGGVELGRVECSGAGRFAFLNFYPKTTSSVGVSLPRGSMGVGFVVEADGVLLPVCSGEGSEGDHPAAGDVGALALAVDGVGGCGEEDGGTAAGSGRLISIIESEGVVEGSLRRERAAAEAGGRCEVEACGEVLASEAKCTVEERVELAEKDELTGVKVVDGTDALHDGEEENKSQEDPGAELVAMWSCILEVLRELAAVPEFQLATIVPAKKVEKAVARMKRKGSKRHDLGDQEQ